MHRPVLAHDNTRIEEGLALLRAYAEISDPRVRKEILAWVMDIRAGVRSGRRPTGLSKAAASS